MSTRQDAEKLGKYKWWLAIDKNIMSIESDEVVSRVRVRVSAETAVVNNKGSLGTGLFGGNDSMNIFRRLIYKMMMSNSILFLEEQYIKYV